MWFIIFPFPFPLVSIIQFKSIIVLEYHINLHIKVSKMQKCDTHSNKIDIKMTSMYNKLWKKQNEFSFYSSRWQVIFASRTKIIKSKKHTNHLISSINCVCSIIIFSSFILFYNVNNNFKRFHKLQMYFNSYIDLAKQWSYVEFILFCDGFTLKTTYDPRDIEFK